MENQEEKKEAEAALVEMTLGELNGALALGIITTDGTFSTALAIRPWRMLEEKELGVLKETNKDANLAQYVTMVLATMVTKCGPHDFASMKVEERRAHIQQMYAGDVFSAYCHLRAASMGNDLDLGTTCPHCRLAFDLNADLSTLKVTVAKCIEDLIWEYRLKHPIQFRGKQVDGFTMMPLRWTHMEQATSGGANMGAAKAVIIAGAINTVLGSDQKIAVVPSELDELAKIDIEGISAKLDDKPLGPQMAVEIDCPRCHRHLVQPVRWDYDSFFSVSSR